MHSGQLRMPRIILNKPGGVKREDPHSGPVIHCPQHQRCGQPHGQPVS